MEKQIEDLIEQNDAIKERTPWLDISRGGLRTALEHWREHDLQSKRPDPKPEASKSKK